MKKLPHFTRFSLAALLRKSQTDTKNHHLLHLNSQNIFEGKIARYIAKLKKPNTKTQKQRKEGEEKNRAYIGVNHASKSKLHLNEDLGSLHKKEPVGEIRTISTRKQMA